MHYQLRFQIMNCPYNYQKQYEQPRIIMSIIMNTEKAVEAIKRQEIKGCRKTKAREGNIKKEGIFSHILKNIFIQIKYQFNRVHRMRVKFLLLLLLSAFYSVHSSIVTNADFLYQVTYTNSYMWNNYVGVILNLNEVINNLNTTQFQGYMLNTNLGADWENNFAVTLRMPKDWYYDCNAVGINPNDTNACKFQIKTNPTFLNHLGQYIWNTASQPYWSFGLNNQFLDLSNTTVKTSVQILLYRVYLATHAIIYNAEMMSQGDLSVANNMRSGNYTPQNFLAESTLYDQILYGLPYKAPGLSEYGGSDWLSIIPDFHANVQAGIFSFEPIIFLDPALATIQNLLNDNYTKGYFRRRLRVNSSFTYSNFSQLASLERVRLVPNEGIDGITNTFAAAVWWIDFLMEASLYGFYDVSIEGARRTGNYQSIFGPPPLYSPTSLYYGSIMAILAVEKSPRVVLPTLTSGLSSNIKIWGLETTLIQKFLILNKDTNPSLSGTVNIQIRADSTIQMTCVYMKAPSLTSKADQMTLGGHTYIGGNFVPQGSYEKLQLSYSPEIKGYSVPISYAQVALCEIPNANLVIPRKQQCYELSLFLACWVLIVMSFIL